MRAYGVTYNEQAFLQLSGLQHFSFCRRQWALIHIEQQWQENLRTVEGQLLHGRAHDEQQRERRGEVLILRGLSVFSRQLGLSGKCDVVEFHPSQEGIPLQGEEGRWLPFPVEYKRGEPKKGDADRLQLCAQAICLEEMLCCKIAQGALFYGEIKRRVPVEFDAALRDEAARLSAEMHALYSRGHTPKARPTKGCNACSLKELCLPGLAKHRSAAAYLTRYIEEDET